MKRIDPTSVMSLENDGKASYKHGRMHSRGTEWRMRYRTFIPKTGRPRAPWYRVYVSESYSNPSPFIIVRGERHYLTPDFAQKVTAS